MSDERQCYDERWDYGPTVRVPQVEHLVAEHRPGVCCTHDWSPVPEGDEVRKQVQGIFDERDLGLHQHRCARCGALSLWDAVEDFRGEEAVMLVAYDGLARFMQPEEEPRRERPRPERPRGRSDRA